MWDNCYESVSGLSTVGVIENKCTFRQDRASEMVVGSNPKASKIYFFSGEISVKVFL